MVQPGRRRCHFRPDVRSVAKTRSADRSVGPPAGEERLHARLVGGRASASLLQSYRTISCCDGSRPISFPKEPRMCGVPFSYRSRRSSVDRTRRWLAIGLLLVAAGAEVPRQLLFRASAADTHTPSVSHSADHQRSPARPERQASEAPAAESWPLAANAPLPGSSCWLLEVPLEGAATVSRRDRAAVPPPEDLGSQKCCLDSTLSRLWQLADRSHGDRHASGSAFVVACRLIPLRN